MKRKNLVGQFFGILIFGLAISAHGESKELNFSVGVDGFSDDNYGLQAEAKDTVSGSQQYANLAVEHQSETMGMSAGARWVDRYLHNSDRREDDHHEVFTSLTYMMQTSSISTNLRLKQDTTLADDFLASGPTTVEVDRQQYTASVGYRNQFSEVFSLNTQFSLQQLQFEGSDIDLREYQYLALSLQPFWSYSKKAAVYSRVFSSLVKYDDFDIQDLFEARRLSYSAPAESKTHGASFGWRYQFSESLLADVSAGYRESFYEYKFLSLFAPAIELESESDGIVFDGSLVYQRERGSSSVALTRESTTNSAGSVVEETQFLLENNYSFSETLTSSLSASWKEQSNETLSEEDNLTSYVLKANLSWKILPKLQLGGGVRYLVREIGTDNTEAGSIRFNVGLKWKLDPVVW